MELGSALSFQKLRQTPCEVHKIGWHRVVTDIEDRKRAEDKIHEQESELRQIVDLVPQLVVVYGQGGERLYANRVSLDYLGVSLEEWRQRPGNLTTPA
jgi:PAS domain-containing protein